MAEGQSTITIKKPFVKPKRESQYIGLAVLNEGGEFLLNKQILYALESGLFVMFCDHSTYGRVVGLIPAYMRYTIQDDKETSGSERINMLIPRAVVCYMVGDFLGGKVIGSWARMMSRKFIEAIPKDPQDVNWWKFVADFEREMSGVVNA
jgi:hypothetical protein